MLELNARKFAEGWFDNAPFKAICEKHVSRIKEMFFAWPGVLSCRPAPDYAPELRRRKIHLSVNQRVHGSVRFPSKSSTTTSHRSMDNGRTT